MESLNAPNKQSTISPFSYLHMAPSNSDSNLISLKESPKSIIKNHQSKNNNNSFHQRCSSASSLLLNVEDDQPSWLEDLLAEPEATRTIQQKSHRRSSSDSFAILEESFDNKSTSSDDKSSKSQNENHDKEDPNSQNGKSNTTKMELKRAKQHSAHRSRVRKLKYIHELETTVQLLQAEGSGIQAEIQAELEFLNQQNLMLSMENIALRQRLDSVSHEQLIKHFEQEMLEKELGRLKLSINYKMNNKMQIQQQMMQR